MGLALQNCLARPVGLYPIAVATAMAVATGGWASPAAAEFRICNQTLDVVNVALGYEADQTFRTEGWWTVGPNQCAAALRDPLSARYVYVFAQDVFGNVLLEGAAPMCVRPRAFREPVGVGDCVARGMLEARFHEVDTLDSARWTLFLGMRPIP